MEFTAIYDTDSMKNVEYSFMAKDLDHAVSFCKRKFSVKTVRLEYSSTGINHCERMIDLETGGELIPFINEPSKNYFKLKDGRMFSQTWNYDSKIDLEKGVFYTTERDCYKALELPTINSLINTEEIVEYYVND